MAQSQSGTVGVSADELRALAAEMRERADALDAMADEQKSQDGDGIPCEHCDRTFGNAGAATRHALACEAEQKSQEGGAFPAPGELADEYAAADVPAIVAAADDEQNRRIADGLNRPKSASDAGIADTAAKALVSAMGGEKSQYVAAFGVCTHDGCDRGANGLAADVCHKHA